MTITAKHAKPASGNPFLPLVLDVAVPLGAYYLLRHVGFSLVTSLAVSGLLSSVRVVWTAVRERKVDGLAAAVLVLTVISIPIAFVTGSPKLMLAKEALGTGPLGVWVIVSALISKPAMANGMRAFLARTEGSALAWEQLVAGSARFRSSLNAASMVWGIGFLVECLSRLVMVIVLPVDTAVWAVNIPPAVLMTACVFAQGPWAHRMAIMVKERVAENDRRAQPMPVALAA
ncbi:MAG TPA: VC0807 family protein [Pseudonocardiaceae bacterium]|jgi:hypothetical protein|nr:VC0807 family protein [Pseudonocardiaceae bacterium]